MIKRLFATTALVISALAVSAPAFANFIIDTDPGDELKFYIEKGKEADGVNTFAGIVGSNVSGPVVDVLAIGSVDTGSGWATIKPVKDGSLTKLTFTPVDPKLFGDFSFRGQLLKDLTDVKVTVQDNQGNPTQSFDFIVDKKGPADFSRIGIISTDGESIKWVMIEGDFKEVKQIAFSLAVPEPETYAMMLAGLGLLGTIARRRKASQQ